MKKFLLLLILTISLPALSLANQIDEEFIRNYTYKLSSIEKPIKLENGQYSDGVVKVTLVKYVMKGQELKKEEKNSNIKLPDAVVVFLIEKDKHQDYEITSLIEVGEGEIIQSNSISLTKFMDQHLLNEFMAQPEQEKVVMIENITMNLYTWGFHPSFDPHIDINIALKIGDKCFSGRTISLSLRKVGNQYELTKHEPEIVRKPAIYLYPERDMNVEVYLEPLGKIAQSIPEYENSWKVNVTRDGLIDGKYNYLFYEAELFFPVNPPAEGWLVPYIELKEWFEKNLLKIGLNEREAKDFIDYWISALEPAKYYIIKLLSREWIDNNLAVEIRPAPKTFIRLIFYFEPTDDKIVLKEPKIETPKREGFTAVEWGGIVKKSKKGDIKTEDLHPIELELLKKSATKQQEIGFEILKGFSVTKKEVSIKVNSGGCTGKDTIKPYVRIYLDKEKNIPICEIIFVRILPDFCKAFFPDGVNIVYDIEQDLKIRGPCIIKVNNPVFTVNLINWFTIGFREEKPIPIENDSVIEEIALKLNLISSTIQALEKEIRRYEESNHPDKEEKIVYLKKELAKFKNMRPEEYVLESKEKKELTALSFGPLMPPVKEEVEVIVEDKISIGSMLKIVNMTKSGPFYHVARLSGDLEGLKPGRYKFRIYLVYKREYFGFIPNYYVYVDSAFPVKDIKGSRLTPDIIKNFTYHLKFSKEYITLKRGKYERTKDLKSFLTVKLVKYLIRDLNKDLKPDAVVILAQSGGGSGTFYEITALLTGGNEVYQTDSYLLGDRIEIKNLEVVSEKWQTRIYVGFKKWAPDKKKALFEEKCFVIYKGKNSNRYELFLC